MRKLALILAIAALLVGASACGRLSTRADAVAQLRIVNAPATLSFSASSGGDLSVSVSIENYTDTTLFTDELATAYLTSYRATLFVGDEECGTVEIPERRVIKAGATVDIDTLLVTAQEKELIIRRYGVFNSLVGYVDVEYRFSDSYGNTFTLSYKPAITISY